MYLNDIKSNVKRSNNGLIQDLALAPLLFNIYTAPTYLKHIHHHFKIKLKK